MSDVFSPGVVSPGVDGVVVSVPGVVLEPGVDGVVVSVVGTEVDEPGVEGEFVSVPGGVLDSGVEGVLEPGVEGALESGDEGDVVSVVGTDVELPGLGLDGDMLFSSAVVSGLEDSGDVGLDMPGMIPPRSGVRSSKQSPAGAPLAGALPFLAWSMLCAPSRLIKLYTEDEDEMMSECSS